MVFSSLPFLFLFLTVVLLVSHILPFRFRNFFLLLANLVFYAYGVDTLEFKEEKDTFTGR